MELSRGIDSNLATASYVEWNVDYDLEVGNWLTVIGYGHDVSGGTYTDTLEYANLTYINNTECQKIFDDEGE